MRQYRTQANRSWQLLRVYVHAQALIAVVTFAVAIQLMPSNAQALFVGGLGQVLVNSLDTNDAFEQDQGTILPNLVADIDTKLSQGNLAITISSAKIASALTPFVATVNYSGGISAVGTPNPTGSGEGNLAELEFNSDIVWKDIGPVGDSGKTLRVFSLADIRGYIAGGDTVTIGYAHYWKVKDGPGMYTFSTVQSFTESGPFNFVVDDYQDFDNPLGGLDYRQSTRLAIFIDKGGVGSTSVELTRAFSGPLAVPEPSTFALTALGLVAIGYFTLRRKSAVINAWSR